MSRENPTLQELFVPSGSDRGLPELKRAVAQRENIVKWEAVRDVLADKALEMLDMPVLGVLLSAWKKYREIEQTADSEARSEKRKVFLAQHTLTSEHHPYLEIRVKGIPVDTLKFTVLLELVIKGFSLTIRDRKIITVQTGTMTGQGSLALEGTVIMEKEFGTIQLPGTIQLGHGIPLE